MKKIVTMFSILIAGLFILTPPANAAQVYERAAQRAAIAMTTLMEICGGEVCKGGVVGGQLILFGKDGKRYVAPDGDYMPLSRDEYRVVGQVVDRDTGAEIIEDDGKVVRIINGKIFQKTDQSMK